MERNKREVKDSQVHSGEILLIGVKQIHAFMKMPRLCSQSRTAMKDVIPGRAPVCSEKVDICGGVVWLVSLTTFFHDLFGAGFSCRKR